MTCRRYTSALLVAVGVVVGVLLALFDVWWGLIGAVFVAFLFGAAIARPWCVAGDARSESQLPSSGATPPRRRRG